MKNGIVANIWRVREMVLDTFDGTIAITRACWKLPVHCRFARCNNDSACFQNLPLPLVIFYAKRVLSPDCGKAGFQEAVGAKTNL